MRCPVKGCGEPWDFDSLHDEVLAQNPGKPWYVDGVYSQEKYDRYFKPALRAFQRIGCEFFGTSHSTEPEDEADGLPASEVAGLMYELLGDDLDGAEAMMEDMGL